MAFSQSYQLYFNKQGIMDKYFTATLKNLLHKNFIKSNKVLVMPY